MIEVRTPCRLHFGLLALGAAFSSDPDDDVTDSGTRHFGGVGLMVREPDIVVQVVESRAGFTAAGPMHERAAEFARRFATRAAARRLGEPLTGAEIHVVRAPRSHTGLGTGTQLGMAVARALAQLIGREDLGPHDLARLVGRGKRSAIGLHGFFHGGLIVEGGKSGADDISPMVVQQPFPDEWRIVLITPDRLAGVAGQRETHAFSTMKPMPDAVTGRLCQLTLLGLLPAVIDRDLVAFSEALFEMQQLVGSAFADAQGGVYADAMLESIVSAVREMGVTGVGQSSWGPTLYALCGDEESAQEVATHVRDRFALGADEVRITRADNEGSSVRQSSAPAHRSAAATRRGRG